ncbi:uncharacterized protein LOC110720533 [Chenopodium quinoa]|uniref:Cysteine proteinase inhibitor n=1 Tax=Chenopodium quinoa TaxID=63459 RepID=A0A803M4R5_CHEQI|nr:uncharacterized protein LOC110714532 [Chenopodium quinoa]XP_021755260.1 uncharacterized protein LOC110720531 [Chenopodium quinoa]XP_021755264.1 uncharacterized protein LOC110720533 [Chenopodium quinoa]
MSSSDQQENTLGGRHPVDANGLKIQEVAAWAVAEYNKKQGTNLKFEKVLRAEQDGNIGSTTYYIDLEASEDCKTNNYYAQVIEIITETPIKELQKFHVLLLGDEPTPVAN